MPRKGSDNFGDQVSGPPTPNFVPSENAQLRQRHLNETGLPNGVRDNHREDGEGEADGQGQVPEPKTTGTRTRKGKRKDSDTSSGGTFTDRLRSPLGSSLKLDDLREQFSKNVEVK